VAKQEYFRIEADRWEGRYTDTVAKSKTNGSVSPASSTVVPGKPLAEVIKLYFKENKRADRTDGQIKAELERFLQLITGGGERPINLITKADVRTYKENILHARGLSLTTCIKHLSNLSVVFKWAEAQGFIPENSNPVRGLSPNKRQAKKQAALRRPFTDEELLKVFGSTEFRMQRDTHPDRYWLCLICLFEICRREEAGQLNVSDIDEQEGIAFIRITDEGEGQALKNEGSKRRVPIHSALVKLGFLEYVQRIKTAGHTRLFPQLKRGANGYSDAVGKWFSRLVTKVGLIDPALVLHSLRHGGITKLHAAGAAHSTVEILAGHAAAGVQGQTYVHRNQLPLALLRDGLEKLKYPDVVKALT
jgi:integrase